MKEQLRTEAEKVLQYIPRYSFDEKPDNKGRWARKIMHKELCIGWISILNNGKESKYSLRTYFPVSGNDMPFMHKLFDDYDSAVVEIESQWENFKSILDFHAQQSKERDGLHGILDFLTNENSKYSIMYGNQKDRFADDDREYTISEMIEIYKSTLTK